MEGVIPYLLVLVIFVLGIFFIISPVSFIGGSWLKYFRWFGLLGFVIMMFSEDVQKWVIRVVGVLYCLGGMCLGGVILTLGAVDSVAGKLEEEIAASEAAFRERLDSEGPVYTETVIQGLKQQRPQWYIETPDAEEPMYLLITDTQTLLQAEYDLKLEFAYESPPEEAVNSVLIDAPGGFEWERQNLQEEGTIQQVLNDRRAKYGPHIMAARQGGAAGQPLANQPQAGGQMTADQMADMHIQKASERWRANDIQTSMKHAEEAWKLRVQTYGQGHQKVVEVENMIRAAQQRLAAVPQPVQ
ncbi:MAG: hypothetical protein PWP23_1187 [Candidatus Sumerlaeota bacterium]|nr:hypothetical protein [Candidatus Sumerlaeota bacterium]